MIKFKILKWKNFISYGNYWTSMDFEKNPTTIITGKNGAGKSVFLDALTFALFGKPYRFINKPRLVNSINDKDCLVELTFEIGKKSYLIRRGLKPVIFEIWCDGVQLPQDSKILDYQKQLEETILKLNFNTFCQIVVLGTAIYVPFMQLTAAQRREVIEELLDLNVFSRMNETLKEKSSIIKEQIKDVDNKIDIIKEKISVHQVLVNKLKNKSKEDLNNKLVELESNNKAIKNLQDSVSEQTSLIEQYTKKSNILLKSNKINEFIDVKNKLLSQITSNNKTIHFYKNNDTCPICKQDIENTFKQSILEDKQKNIIEIENALKEIELKIIKHKEIEKEYNDYLSKITKCNVTIAEENIKISTLMNINTKIQQSISNSSTSEIETEEKTLKQYSDELNILYIDKQKFVDDKHNYDIIQGLLKDTGIKSKIIKQYLPLMNKMINKYLAAMDFYVSFNLDETFKETIKSRHRDDYEYNSFSEGEKFRIDMALLLTWREIAKTKNSTNTNILILDEVFDSSLDAYGTDEFLKLLKALSQTINIFVISHKPDLLSNQFDSTIKVEKKNDFSKLSQ